MRVVLLMTLLWSAACTSVPDPDDAISLDVEGRAQRRNLSCESRSACDLLGHYGIRVEEDAFLAQLPASDNPDHGFVGNVDGPTGQLPPHGYGVHEQPVATTLGTFGLPAGAHRGESLRWLHDHIRAGRPVIVWATSTLRPGRAVTLHDRQGASFQAVRGEHTYIATGWDAGRNRIELLDSATGRSKWVSLPRFEAAWSTLGRRAVVAEGGADASGHSGS